MSKRVDAVNHLRAMTLPDLDAHVAQQRRRLFELRLQQATGQVENHRELRFVRRELSRSLTLRGELEQQPEEVEV
ncbi:MAG TPA: 50S ribosomal protein L29 [Candidatus Sulfotelmatobacter sp.]|nr:50S ribosomal protein L29 [Candidatus Sulfotelmatobacter sp.]